VYACGVLLYEGISGRRPFNARTYKALLLEITSSTPPPLSTICPHVPHDLGEIVARAMARDRNDRFPSAGAFLGELARLSAVPDRVPTARESWEVATMRDALAES